MNRFMVGFPEKEKVRAESVSPRWVRLAARSFPIAALLFALGGYFTVYFMRCNGPPIRSDGIGYYAFLPGLFLQHDLHFEGLPQVLKQYYATDISSGLPLWTGIQRYEPTGWYFDKYPIGVAVMCAPFFFVAHLACLLFEQPSDGFAMQYQFFVATAGLFYGLIGLVMLQRYLERDFGVGPALGAVVSIFLGTDLYHYMTYDSMFSHAFSFFLVVCLLHLTRAWYEKPGYHVAFGVGLVTGLLLIVRNPNFIYLMIIPLYGLGQNVSWRDRLRPFLERPYAAPMAIALAALIFFPQMMYWHFSTGHWLFRSYPGEQFDFLHPNLLGLMFSVRKGLFFWAPILLFGVAGWLTPRFRRHPLMLSSIVIVVYQIYFIASWWSWWFGGSFGHRAFIESFPFFAIPMAALFASLPNWYWRSLFIVVCSLLIFLCMVEMIQYWKRITPYDLMNWEIFKASFMQIMRHSR